MNRDKIIELMKSYVEEMEGYSYFGSNMGIPEDEIEDIADKIVADTPKKTQNSD